jgi:hypothetical protein
MTLASVGGGATTTGAVVQNMANATGSSGQRREQRRRARSCANTAIVSPKARGRPASRRTSSTVDVLALRHPSNGMVVTVAPWRRKTLHPSG